MKRFFLAIVALCFSASLFAQTDMQPSDEVQPTAMPSDAPAMSPAAESADDRIQRECREWAVQDGVPPEELPTYINDCIEDRQVQE